MSDQEMIGVAIDRADCAWAVLRTCLVDPKHLNKESKEAKCAAEELSDAVTFVWKMKNAIASVEFWKSEAADAAKETR